MWAGLRACQPGKSLARILWWKCLSTLCFFWVGGCYRLRAWGAGNVPARGGVLYVVNHQSYLDPIIVGLGCGHRQFCSLARETLFHRRLFAWLIRSLNAIPVVQGAADKTAMRRCLDSLADGHAFLIFPEGARTLDGRTQRFAPGTMLLIKRARPMVVPVAIEGAFDAWPRNVSLPRLTGRIGVQFGKAMPAETLIAMGADAALSHLQQRVEMMRQELSMRLCGPKQVSGRVECFERAV